MSILNKTNYNIKTWKEVYPDNAVNLKKLYLHDSWDFLKTEMDKPYFKKLERHLSKTMNDIILDCILVKKQN